MRRCLLLVLVSLMGAAPAAAQAPIVEYYHLDATGSVRAVTDQNGTVVRRHDYFPFGEEYAAVPAADPVRFAGKERDVETGLDYFVARYYAGRIGRFTTVDPDHVGGDIFDPQSWNGYAYARNNPLRFLDPTGTDYYVAVDDGSPFWFEGGYSQFERFAEGYRLLGGSERGFILNGAGRIVGTYTYFDPFNRMLAEAGRRASPGVDAAAGAFVAFASVVAPVPMAIAGCAASGASCSAAGTGIAALPLAGRLRFTATTASRMTQVGRHVPVQILAEAIKRGTRMPDPQNAPGAIKIVQEIFVNGTRRTLTIIYREADNTILHFHYQ